MPRTKYVWHNLKKQGDWIVIEDLEPIKIRTTVAAYIRRRFGPDAIVMTRQIPTGTIVVLAYVPPVIAKEISDEPKASKSTTPSSFLEGDPDEDIEEFLDD